MSSILTRGSEETTSSTGVGEQLVQAVEVAQEQAESGDGSDSRGRIARTFLLIDLGAAVGYLLGNRSSPAEAIESGAEEVLDTDLDSGFEAEVEVETESDDDGGGGRSTLSRLFLLGAVVGAGYMIRQRMGSVDRVVDQATERAQSVADETAMRSGEVAGQTETVAEETAERIEETGERAANRVESGSEEVADRVREGGEEAADTVQEGGEGTAERIEDAEEQAEEMTDEDDEESA